MTVPLEDIRRIHIYINDKKKSLTEIKRETGADYILNGTLYNMSTSAVLCHLKADGIVYADPPYSVAGYAWNTGEDFRMDMLPSVTANYIGCTPLIVSGKPLSKLTYDAGQGGKRGRSAIGIKQGRLGLYCTKDGTSHAKTPEALRDELVSYGWESAVMLDGGGSSQCDFNGQTVTSTRKVQHLILVYLKEGDNVGVKTYSLKNNGSTYISANFRIREFACNDGSDSVVISEELVEVLQKIRDHFGKAVVINSAYRTPAYNKKVGGAVNSQHVKGTAADIVVAGVDPLSVAQYAEFLMPSSGGIGVYQTFTHVDVRASRARWDNRSGKEVAVSGWPGYSEKTEADLAVEWVTGEGILRGDTSGNLMLEEPLTRKQFAVMLYRYHNNS